MDPRLTPANGRVAAEVLKGQVAAKRYVAGEAARIAVPWTDLCRAPDGSRDRQLLLGDAVAVYERRAGWAFVQAEKDSYVGYVAENALGTGPDPTHWVAARASHLYPAPDVKAREIGELVFGAALALSGLTDGFAEMADGKFVPAAHLWAIDRRFDDPVMAAELFLGAPYLWGGNTIRGIDCSGLVQAALLAAGIGCPGDSDMQAALGREVDAGELRRGDLVFWQGHVGLMADAGTLLHANAHHMVVAREPLAAAERRISATGGGEVTARRRIVPA